MIFIGGGSLLWRAVRFADTAGHTVDLVCVDDQEDLPGDHRILRTDDVNNDYDILRGAATDDVVFSINNPTILRAPLVGSDLRIYNIHNGPLPAYRGLPEIAIVHAILAGDTTYGATLHAVDTGIDTGAVFDTEDFPIDPRDGFQDVMMSGLRACHTLFERNLDAVLADDLTPTTPRARGGGSYFGRSRLPHLAGHRANPEYPRATNLGVFTPLYPDLVAALAAAPTTESEPS
ncbi:formyltransferase family protein [Rhodococcus qingshengii]|uniref:formyltransferase family protein n=1 Tax=Rhodococcus qingshengii TaxID=334542 RepID=UPI0021B14450|nr:formyltransferase family protein [Rhodococcus qingshengii]MCT6735549.1 formyltransferase family protein [Rhodococcus qingshengii]